MSTPIPSPGRSSIALTSLENAMPSKQASIELPLTIDMTDAAVERMMQFQYGTNYSYKFASKADCDRTRITFRDLLGAALDVGSNAMSGENEAEMTPKSTRILANRANVFAECDRLFECGEKITKTAIHAALGGGSPNGIYQYMDEWQAQHLVRFQQLQALAERPRLPGIPDLLWKAIVPVWELLVSEAASAGRTDLAQSSARNVKARLQPAVLPEPSEALHAHHAQCACAALESGKDTILALNAQLTDSRNDYNDQLAAQQAVHGREIDRLLISIERERKDFARREKAHLDRIEVLERPLKRKSVGVRAIRTKAPS